MKKPRKRIHPDFYVMLPIGKTTWSRTHLVLANAVSSAADGAKVIILTDRLPQWFVDTLRALGHPCAFNRHRTTISSTNPDNPWKLTLRKLRKTQ